jgi:hypothetical protein
VRDSVSYPYKRAGKILILYVLILNFLERTWEDIKKNNMYFQWAHAKCCQG